MLDATTIAGILNHAPSVELLRLRNREVIIVFLVDTFGGQPAAVAADTIHARLADLLEYRQLANDEDSGIQTTDTHEPRWARVRIMAQVMGVAARTLQMRATLPQPPKDS